MARIARQRVGYPRRQVTAPRVALAEQRLAATSISLAALAAAATASPELCQAPQETAVLQYLAALGWERAVQMLLTLRVLVPLAQAVVAAAVAVAPALAALAGPVS